MAVYSFCWNHSQSKYYFNPCKIISPLDESRNGHESLCAKSSKVVGTASEVLHVLFPHPPQTASPLISCHGLFGFFSSCDFPVPSGAPPSLLSLLWQPPTPIRWGHSTGQGFLPNSLGVGSRWRRWFQIMAHLSISDLSKAQSLTDLRRSCKLKTVVKYESISYLIFLLSYCLTLLQALSFPVSLAFLCCAQVWQPHFNHFCFKRGFREIACRKIQTVSQPLLGLKLGNIMFGLQIPEYNTTITMRIHGITVYNYNYLWLFYGIIVHKSSSSNYWLLL